MKLRDLIENKLVQNAFGDVKPHLSKFKSQFTPDQDELFNDEEEEDKTNKNKYHHMGMKQSEFDLKA